MVWVGEAAFLASFLFAKKVDGFSLLRRWGSEVESKLDAQTNWQKNWLYNQKNGMRKMRKAEKMRTTVEPKRVS